LNHIVNQFDSQDNILELVRWLNHDAYSRDVLSFKFWFNNQKALQILDHLQGFLIIF